jgi:transposase
VSQKNGKQAIGKSRGRWNTKVHAVVAGSTHLKAFSLSGGEEQDAPAGRLLLEIIGKLAISVHLLMDRAYSDWKTRWTAWSLRFNPVVPPKSNALDKWEYDKELYKKRNEIERFFSRLKVFRAVFTRYDKPDSTFSATVLFASIIILLRLPCVNTP